MVKTRILAGFAAGLIGLTDIGIASGSAWAADLYGPPRGHAPPPRYYAEAPAPLVYISPPPAAIYAAPGPVCYSSLKAVWIDGWGRNWVRTKVCDP